MRTISTGKILAGQTPDKYAGRANELEQIVRCAGQVSFTGAQLSFAPRSGATELLLQAYDRMFREQGEVIPVYYSLRDHAGAVEAAREFVRELLTQIVAFRRNDPGTLFSSLSLDELSREALPADSAFVDEMIRNLEAGADDPALIVRKSLSVPSFAAAHGLRIFVMLDDLHIVRSMSDGQLITGSLAFLSRRPDFPFLTAAYRRSNVFQYELRRIELQPMLPADSAMYIEGCAEEFGISVSDPVRDLLRLSASGDLAVIRGILRRAAMDSLPLETYRDLASIYSSSVFGGTVRSIYDGVIRRACGGSIAEVTVVRLLHETIDDAGSRPPTEVWEKHLGLDAAETQKLIRELHCEELVRSVSNRIEPMSENHCFADYVAVRYGLEIEGTARAAAFAGFGADFLRRAPSIMEQEYRRSSALGLREALAAFDGKEVPRALFDYGDFKLKYKGLAPQEIKAQMQKDEEFLTLPRIVFSAHTDSFYKAIGLLTESERSAVAVGFETRDEEPDQQIVWIAAEVDAKLEADTALAEFWCDRLEMAAVMCGFERYQLWLIAPEGFTDEAVELMRGRSFYSSSRKQAELLRDRLAAGPEQAVDQPLEEYEIVIPMGDDAEMVAAHALEDIARRHNFGTKEINQIKTALVEACINAAEHSHSLDRRIHQKFVVGPGHITITVTNRGIRLIDKRNAAPPTDEGRRGWGINLMRQLMDEVRIEQVDDGTRISMTKYLSVANAA